MRPIGPPVVAYLADTSCMAHAGQAPVRARLDALLSTGDLVLCAPTRLELLIATPARAVAERAVDLAAYPSVPITEGTFARAEAVLAMLAPLGHHRAPSIADLVLAATAEIAGLVVLHYDADIDLVAEVTGQPTEWVAPAGSLDR